MDTSLDDISVQNHFVGYQTLIGRGYLDQRSLPESLELEESLQPQQFLEQSRLEPTNAFQLIEKDILRELSVSNKGDGSLCLYSRSSGSINKGVEGGGEAAHPQFPWKTPLITSKEDQLEKDKKKRKMKIWGGTLRLKQVENPSIGLDLSHRSKSMGPKRNWKQEKMIREEEEEEESKRD